MQIQDNNLEINITTNQNGKVYVWLDNPKRGNGKWEGKFLFCNSIINKKAKKISKEINATWETDVIGILV